MHFIGAESFFSISKHQQPSRPCLLGSLNYHLKQMGKVDQDTCGLCELETRTIEHNTLRVLRFRPAKVLASRTDDSNA